MDLANTIILLGAAHGLFFSLVLAGLPGGNRAANRWFALFLAQFALGMAGTVAYNVRFVIEHPQLGLLHTPLALLAGPTFYLYILFLTKKSHRFGGWQWLHFLPFLMGIVWLAPFYALSPAEKRAILEASYSTEPEGWKHLFHFTNLVNVGYIAIAFALILRHRRAIRKVFSNTADKGLDWAQNFTYFGAAILVTCIICSRAGMAFADTVSNILFSVLIYVMGFRALRQPEIFAGLRPETVAETEDAPLLPLPDKYQKSGLSDEKAAPMLARLDRLMADEKPYLDPELTLQTLADRLETTPHTVSQLLNQHKKASFFDFVNGLRVARFKLAVQDPANAHLSMLGVALDCGFNSKAAFNAVFKRMTGQTPSDFRRSPAV